MSDSPFLTIPESEWLAHNAFAFAIRDKHPVSPGHTLVITKRVVSSWFDATREEQDAVIQLVATVKLTLDATLHPDGYNVGFNVGDAAGQTVMHVHVHVIPRFVSDMDDPRGGVRHVIPSQGNHLRSVSPLATGGESDPFTRQILPLFARSRDIAIVAAFVQESGVQRIAAALHDALSFGARVRLVTGDYLNITQASALEMLLDLCSAWRLSDDDEDEAPRGSFEARVIEVAYLPARSRSFHPKSWRFESAQFGIGFVGSSNLSLSALESGIEWNLRVDRDRDRDAYERIATHSVARVARRRSRRAEAPTQTSARARRTRRPRLTRARGVCRGGVGRSRHDARHASRRQLDAVCAVDIFNEGVLLPALDRVVMLRPTESSLLFMQQLGRGLRVSEGKTSLTVIDFVGNHRVFLERLRTLLSLGSSEQQVDLGAFLAASGALELPAGCAVEVALEMKVLLERLFRTGGAGEVERVYRELKSTHGERPTAGEFQRMGYLPKTVALRHKSWLEFVRSEGEGFARGGTRQDHDQQHGAARLLEISLLSARPLLVSARSERVAPESDEVSASRVRIDQPSIGPVLPAKLLQKCQRTLPFFVTERAP